jgi:hypothetical protein
MIRQCSVGHPAGAPGIICLWVLLTWLTYTYGMLCQDAVALGEFLLVQCACQLFFGLGKSTHVCPDQLLIVISSSGMFAMLGIGSGLSKLW